MNIRTRFLTFLAAAAAVFTGCQQQEADFDLPSIKIEGSGITVDNETKKASFSAPKDLTAITLGVTATRDWKAEIEWDADEVPWINVSPEEGDGTGRTQEVKVTILDNPGYNRAKQIKFNINYDYKTLYITQSGEKGEEIVGTLENPFTVAGVNKYVKTLGSDVQSPNEVYVKGKISKIADAGTFSEGGTFGNATFYISDDGTPNNEFYCYRILYLGNKKFQSGQTDIKVGDEVIICGQLMNYRGNTPETVSGKAYLYSLNGKTDGGDTPPGPSGEAKGTGTLDDPYNALGAANAVKDLTWTSNTEYQSTGDVYIKGKISRIANKGTFTEGGTYGNASFYISDDGKEANEFYCFRVLYLGNKKFEEGQTDIKVGDEVVVYGQLMNYQGNTPETVAGKAYLYSLNGSGGGGDTPGGEIKAMTIAAYLAEPVSTTQWYELTGTVSNIANTTYGNFDLTDDSGKVYVYGLCATKVEKNDKSFASLDIKEGDNITIITLRSEHNGSPQAGGNTPAYLKSKNGGSTPSTEGTGTLDDPYTAVGAAAAVKDLTWTSNTDYQKTEKVYVKGKISRIANKGTYTEGGSYGNASYYISADGTENGEFYIFRSLYFNGEKYTAGTDIKVGDEVIVYGSLMNYQGKTPETVAGENWLYSLNGKTDGGGSVTPSGGTLDNPYTVAQALDAVKDLTWTSNTEYESTDEVYMKGKISKIASKGTFTEGGSYGNASFYISDDGTETNEFYCFRVLYLENKKFEEGQTDIKVGDEVVVCGKLMNYKGNTPETVSGKAYLYSLNGKTEPGSGGGDTPSGSSVSFATNSSAQTWAEATDGTYGSGFGTTTQGLNIAYYKHTSSTAPIVPNENHVRVYKNSVLSIASADGKKIKKIVIGCAPNAGSTSYCFDMAGLEGGASATCDKEALTVTWTGSATKVVLHANNGQVRMEKLTVEFE